jgi:hypothetical protein
MTAGNGCGFCYCAEFHWAEVKPAVVNQLRSVEEPVAAPDLHERNLSGATNFTDR